MMYECDECGESIECECWGSNPNSSPPCSACTNHACEEEDGSPEASDSLKSDGLSTRVFTEANTGRRLEIRAHGRDRLGVFDLEGNIVMDVDPIQLSRMYSECARLCEVAPSRRPQVRSHAVASNVYPGAVLSSQEIGSLTDEQVRYACELVGITPGARGIAVDRERLRKAHLKWIVEHGRAIAAAVEDRDTTVSDLRQDAERLRSRVRELVEERDSRPDCTVAEYATAQGKVLALQQEVEVANARVGETAAALVREQEAVRIAVGSRDELLRASTTDAVEHEQLQARYERAVVGFTACWKALAAEQQERVTCLLGSESEELIAMDDQKTDSELSEAGAVECVAPTLDVGAMLRDAVQLAAVQQASQLAVSKISPVLVQAGLPPAFVQDEKVQRALALLLPVALAQWGDQVPGLRNVKGLGTLSQQQIVLGLADIIGISIRDLLRIGGEMVAALNESTEPLVEQLPRD